MIELRASDKDTGANKLLLAFDEICALSHVEADNGIEGSKAVHYVKTYMRAFDSESPAYLGSQFEVFGRIGGMDEQPNVITAEDVLAVQCLSVTIPVPVVLAVLGSKAEQISTVLTGLPVNLKFEDLTAADFSALAGFGQPMSELWAILRNRENLWGMGATKVSKLMARKRPELVPIIDSVISDGLGLGRQDYWAVWFEAFSADSTLKSRLEAIRWSAGFPHLSLLRVLDIVLWRHFSR